MSQRCLRVGNNYCGGARGCTCWERAPCLNGDRWGVMAEGAGAGWEMMSGSIRLSPRTPLYHRDVRRNRGMIAAPGAFMDACLTGTQHHSLCSVLRSNMKNARELYTHQPLEAQGHIPALHQSRPSAGTTATESVGKSNIVGISHCFCHSHSFL